MSLFQYISASLLSEKKFREVPKSIERSAKRAAELYFLHAKGMSKLLRDINAYDISNDEEWQDYFQNEEATHILPLTTITFLDLETNKKIKCQVMVVYSKYAEYQAEYDPENKYLIIYDTLSKRLPETEITATIIHELTHGFQEYKKTSKSYSKEQAKISKGTSKNLSKYYEEPVEFDAFTTELSYAIRSEYQKLKNDIKNAYLPQTKKTLSKKLEKFLLELKNFIISPAKNYFVYQELSLPKYMDTFEEMLITIQKKPKLQKALKLKLTTLYNSLI